MRKNKKSEDFTELKILIQSEKEEALSGFHPEYFQAKVHQRIEKESSKPSSSLFWQKKPVLAAGAILLLFIVGWAATLIFSPSPYEKEERALKKTISQVLNFQQFSTTEEETETPFRPETELEWTIKRVLYAAHRESISDEEIPHVFNEVLQELSSLDVYF